MDPMGMENQNVSWLNQAKSKLNGPSVPLRELEEITRGYIPSDASSYVPPWGLDKWANQPGFLPGFPGKDFAFHLNLNRNTW